MWKEIIFYSKTDVKLKSIEFAKLFVLRNYQTIVCLMLINTSKINEWRLGQWFTWPRFFFWCGFFLLEFEGTSPHNGSVLNQFKFTWLAAFIDVLLSFFLQGKISVWVYNSYTEGPGVALYREQFDFNAEPPWDPSW